MESQPNSPDRDAQIFQLGSNVVFFFFFFFDVENFLNINLFILIVG